MKYLYNICFILQISQETQRSAVLETLNDRNNQYDPRVLLPQSRKQQSVQQTFSNFDAKPISKPIINRRLPIRPAATTPRPAQPAQPAQFANFQQTQQQQLRAHQLQIQQLEQQQLQLQQLHQQQQRQQQQNIFVPVSAPVQQTGPSQLIASAGAAQNIDLNTLVNIGLVVEEIPKRESSLVVLKGPKRCW